MADNLDKGLDADILQCRTDILRIRQSIVNSRSGEAAGQEVRAAETAAGVTAEIEKSEPAQEHEAVPAPAQEPAPQEDPYAVTRDEIDALLKGEATESPEVAEEPALVEEDPAQFIEQADALFGDDVVAEQIEEYPDRLDDVEPAFEDGPQVMAQPADEDIEAAPAESTVDEEPAVTAKPVEAVADALEIASPVEEDKEPVLAEETPVDEAAEIARPDIEASEPELSEMVEEAEEWMAQIAPEEEEQKAVVGESETSEGIAESVAAEPPIVEETAEVAAFDVEAPELEQAVSPLDFDIDSPVLEDTEGEAAEGQFDEVVSHLHGEEPIVPVEDEVQASQETASEEQEDVNLRIIKDMKGEGQKGDEERAGIPRLDLSESDLAGILESRKNAAATRKGPGRKEKLEVQNPKIETIEENIEIPNLKAETEEEKADRGPQAGDGAQELPMATEATMSAEEERRMDKERQIIARIVAMDIERFCASAARLRQKERAGQR